MAPGPVRALDPGGWEPYLDRDEVLFWQGAPGAGLRFRPSDIFLSLFGLFFGGFAVIWMGLASSFTGSGPGPGGFGSLFSLFGLPFLAVGCYLAFGRFFWDAYVRSKTRYALTSKRGIIATNALTRKIKSWPINENSEIEFQPGSEATLYFAKEIRRGNKGGNYTVKKGFEYITDGDHVYQIMRGVQQGLTGDHV